jgi:hypothetical protein
MAAKKKKRRSQSTEDRFVWMLIAAGSAMVAAMVIDRGLTAGWRAATSEDPPENPSSPDTSWGDALLWTAGSALAVGLGQVLARRGAAAGWEHYKGKLPPL